MHLVDFFVSLIPLKLNFVEKNEIELTHLLQARDSIREGKEEKRERKRRRVYKVYTFCRFHSDHQIQTGNQRTQLLKRCKTDTAKAAATMLGGGIKW